VEAEHAAEKPPFEVSNTSQLRDLAQSAARIFGWDSEKQQGNTYNTALHHAGTARADTAATGGSRTGAVTRKGKE
jgi:hypothetical protein